MGGPGGERVPGAGELRDGPGPSGIPILVGLADCGPQTPFLRNLCEPFNQLNTPVQATYLPSGHILITDQANERVIEVNRAHHVVWQYGKTGVSGAGFDELNNPNSAEVAANGHILIADENNNRVIERSPAATTSSGPTAALRAPSCPGPRSPAGCPTATH
jgi:hypothetical protein